MLLRWSNYIVTSLVLNSKSTELARWSKIVYFHAFSSSKSVCMNTNLESNSCENANSIDDCKIKTLKFLCTVNFWLLNSIQSIFLILSASLKTSSSCQIRSCYNNLENTSVLFFFPSCSSLLYDTKNLNNLFMHRSFQDKIGRIVLNPDLSIFLSRSTFPSVIALSMFSNESLSLIDRYSITACLACFYLR